MELHVAGGGPLQSLLRTELGAGVKYYGHPGNREIESLYHKATAFVSLPQSVYHLGIKIWEEQFGFTLAEAMAAGLPVITTNCGASPEVVGDRNLIIEEDSSGAAIEAFREVLGNHDKWLKLGENNALRAASLFNAEKQSDTFERFILDRL